MNAILPISLQLPSCLPYPSDSLTLKIPNSINLFLPYVVGPGGTPRPIELHSHDPLRYVGDMLAWLHQATASEKEHLQSLLKKCSSE